MTCEFCTQGYILPGEPSGTMVDGDYYCAASSGSSKTFAVIVLTDIFGLPLKNPQLIADELSKRLGCDAWVPDVFDGQPPFELDELRPLLQDTGMPDEHLSIWRKLRLLLLGISRSFRLYGSRPPVVDARIASFIAKIKKEKQYESIGAVGYCFGGAMGVRLGSTKLVDSLVICHPSIKNLDDVQKMTVPTSWVCAEVDSSFTKELRSGAEADFASRAEKDALQYEFQVYKGTVHGFAIRPNLSVPVVVEAYKSALEQTAAWFQKTL